jgi:hypothetical protein
MSTTNRYSSAMSFAILHQVAYRELDVPGSGSSSGTQCNPTSGLEMSVEEPNEMPGSIA